MTDTVNHKMMLVSGGAGFIGSNFIKFFLDKHPSYQSINLDKLTYAGSMENMIVFLPTPDISLFKEIFVFKSS